MQKTKKELINSLIKNDGFILERDYDLEDFETIRDGLNDLSKKINEMDKEKLTKYEKRNKNFKSNLFNYYKVNYNYVDENHFIKFINSKDELDIFIFNFNKKHKKSNNTSILTSLLQNQKIHIDDIINLMETTLHDYLNAQIDLYPYFTKHILNRVDLDKNNFEYFYDRFNFSNLDINDVYPNLEYFFKENNNLTIEKYNFLNEKFDIQNKLPGSILKNDYEAMRESSDYRIFCADDSAFYRNKELFKFIINEYHDTINYEEMILKIFDIADAKKISFENFKFIMEYFNNDFSNYGNHISRKITNLAHDYFEEYNQMIKLNEYNDWIFGVIRNGDNDDYIKAYLKEIQYFDSKNTVDIIKLFLDENSSCLYDFISKDGIDTDIFKEKIDRFKTILKNADKNDFDNIYKITIENGDKLGIEIMDEILPKNEASKIKTLKKKF